jgi:hypothetical protein
VGVLELQVSSAGWDGKPTQVGAVATSREVLRKERGFKTLFGEVLGP